MKASRAGTTPSYSNMPRLPNGKVPIAAFTALLISAFAVLAQQSAQRTVKILILGDSLTEGLGVEKEDAFPAKLDGMLRKWRDGVQVVNGGSSGSTSASGLRRLKWYEKAKPDLVLLALGSNDGLRGVKVEETRKNVEAALLFCQSKHWQVVLAGLKVPPNYGAEYAGAFEKIYPELAAKYKVPIVKFLLEGVAGEPGMNQADGIHPNERGHERIAENLFRFFQPLLSGATGKPAPG
ncbi:MAG: lipolytic protein family [Fibrobacteres bacterium]|nr:lipolytic protein family [Fibrobacterota bacterium]